jgi:hypothetical protein
MCLSTSEDEEKEMKKPHRSDRIMKKEGKNKKRCGCNKQCLDFGV